MRNDQKIVSRLALFRATPLVVDKECFGLVKKHFFPFARHFSRNVTLKGTRILFFLSSNVEKVFGSTTFWPDGWNGNRFCLVPVLTVSVLQGRTLGNIILQYLRFKPKRSQDLHQSGYIDYSFPGIDTQNVVAIVQIEIGDVILITPMNLLQQHFTVDSFLYVGLKDFYHILLVL
jgi:hypothetical protein